MSIESELSHAIEIQGLQKVADQHPALEIAALTVGAGEIAALVGPQGSGKAALLELLLGHARPTLGTVRVAGVEPHGQREAFSRRVGVLFAEDSLYRRQSAEGNLRFHCRLRGLPTSRADEVLAQVGLADQARTRLSKLPPGLARRLAFGCAILHQPVALLLLEPFARCDEASIALLSRLIREQADGGAAVLLLADDAAHLSALCDTIHTLSQGRITESLRPADEQRAEMPFKIPVRLEAKVALVNPGDVLFATSEESRTYLQTTEGRLPTQFTLTELEERLARSGFFRAHRGYLVNLQRVKAVIPYTRNSYSLILDDDASTEIPLSKTAARELRDMLGY
jgi:ABC-2 type transport system ATP-binding protein